MPLDEHDARYFMSKHGRKLGCAAVALIAIVVLLIALALIVPLFAPQEVEYDDMGRPGVERGL